MMRKVMPESMKEMGMEPSTKAYYPNVCFDAKTLPEGKDWKVGKTYQVTLRVTMTGTSQRKGRDGEEHGHFDFDIVGIDPKGEMKGKPNRYA